MSDERPKRRLTLMPEVLPLPTQLPGAKAGQEEAAPPSSGRGALPSHKSGARNRTLDHMRKLLAGATATVALASCSSPDAKPEDKPSASAKTTASATGSAETRATATASATTVASATADSVVTASDGTTSSAGGNPIGTTTAMANASVKASAHPTAPKVPTGYMVVDPVPPPPTRPPKPNP